MKKITLITIGTAGLLIGTAGYFLSRKNSKVINELVSSVKKVNSKNIDEDEWRESFI